MPTTGDNLNLVVEMRVQPGRTDRFLEIFGPCEKATLEENGCLGYRLHRAVADPDRFALLERWAGPRALLDHFATPHFQRFAAGIEAEELLAEPPSPLLGGRRIEMQRLADEVTAIAEAPDAT